MGVSAWRDVCLGVSVSAQWGVCLWGCLPTGGVHLPPCGQTNTCKTLPSQMSFADGKYATLLSICVGVAMETMTSLQDARHEYQRDHFHGKHFLRSVFFHEHTKLAVLASLPSLY